MASHVFSHLLHQLQRYLCPPASATSGTPGIIVALPAIATSVTAGTVGFPLSAASRAGSASPAPRAAGIADGTMASSIAQATISGAIATGAGNLAKNAVLIAAHARAVAGGAGACSITGMATAFNIGLRGGGCGAYVVCWFLVADSCAGFTIYPSFVALGASTLILACNITGIAAAGDFGAITAGASTCAIAYRRIFCRIQSTEFTLLFLNE